MFSHSLASCFLAICLSLGIAFAYWLKPGTETALALLLLLGALSGWTRSRGPALVFWILAGASFGALGFWVMARDLPENRPVHYMHRPDPAPGEVRLRIREMLRHNAFAQRYLGNVTGMDGRPAEGQVLLEIERSGLPAPLEPGQEILTRVLPEPVPQPGNPGQFNYAGYLRRMGVTGRIRLPPGSYLLTGKADRGLRTRMASLRQRLTSRLEGTGLPQPQLGIARALLLGDRTGVDTELQADFRRAGALHLLAVSGLHVGILAAFLSVLLSPLKRLRFGKGLHLCLSMLLLWGYALLAGFAASTVRAVILFSLMGFAHYRQRPGETLHLLCLAWIGMLGLVNPYWLFQVGFQLSFAAVAAIVVLYPALYRWWPWKRAPWSYPGKLISVSLAAQAGTLPLSLFYFHEFPGLFLLSNLVLLPGIGLILALGFACLLLSALSALPPALIALYDRMLSLVSRFVHWVGRQGSYHFDAIPWDLPHLMLAAAATVLAGAYLQSSRRACLPWAVCCLIGLQLWGFASLAREARAHALIVPHRTARAGIWLRRGTHLQVFSADSAAQAPLVRDAGTIWRLRTVAYDALQNHYTAGPCRLRIIDSTGMYSPEEPPPDILLLSGSPRVHLDRLLEALAPGQVVADGSNYHSLLPHWEQSCRKRGIPYHATARNGAYLAEMPRW